MSDKITDSIAVAGNGTAWASISPISASIFASQVELMESEMEASPVGIDYQLPIDGYTATHTLLPGTANQPGEKYYMPNQSPRGIFRGQGELMGVPGYTDNYGRSVAATPYFKLRSHTSAATLAKVTERP